MKRRVLELVLAASVKLLARSAIRMALDTYLHVPFQLPERRFVGLLSCQCDAMLRSLDTRVVSCQKATQPAALKTNQAKKAAKTQAAPSQDVYEVVLEDTVCFPEGAEATDNLTTYFLKNVEGGGQPHDTGTISNAEGKTVKVSNVVRRGLTAVHFAEAPLEEGSSVSVQVDFDRRLDHMQQHTGQHVSS
jgi:misacylated tRNA(Ala) deacylase